jgi:N-hydroxyarylamine O-acetyltransferase
VTFTPDLAAYFERIGYAGPREPTLATLNAIIAAHVRAIPFENLDVLLGCPIRLEPEHIVHKLIHARRGGYCFEQNSLLLWVLSALGYEVKALSARVRVQRRRDEVPPRTHMFLRVEIGGESWLADVGVGGFSVTSALRLIADVTQPTPHEPRRIVREGHWSGFEQRAPDARLFHQIYFSEAWHDVCDFTLEEMHPIDREIGNWFTSTHPNSQFRSRLTVARATANGRLTLLNRDFTVRGADGRAETRTLTSPAELLQVLRHQFGIEFPEGTEFPYPGFD